MSLNNENAISLYHIIYLLYFLQPRERGQMRFHMLQNIETALHFLRCKNVKLVNIRSEDIVDGNPKLTLGLIWTIILHFQVRCLLLLYVIKHIRTYIYIKILYNIVDATSFICFRKQTIYETKCF